MNDFLTVGFWRLLMVILCYSAHLVIIILGIRAFHHLRVILLGPMAYLGVSSQSPCSC